MARIPQAKLDGEVLAPPLSSGDGSARGAVTWRSVGVGSLAVMGVALLTPYNDYVVVNTFFIGGFLPLCVVLALFALVALVNAPLHRWAPSRAMTGGELAVILAMMLAGCSIPSQGLLRYWLPMLVAPQHLGGQDHRFWDLFQSLGLPKYLFPISGQGDARLDRAVTYFYARVPAGEKAPYGAWVVPIAIWGIFIGACWTLLVAMAALVREQWAVNERLAFPLAQVQLSLIEPPERGRALNALFRGRGFWIGLGAVFFLHNLSALHVYFPRNFPEFSLGYRLAGVFSEEPWTYLHWNIKNANIYFTFIGVTYFIQSRIAFSLWATFLILQLFNVQLRMMQTEVPAAAWDDQHLGAALAFVGGMLWIGRHEWLRIGRAAIVGPSEGDRRDGRSSCRGALWTAVGAMGVMFGWLGFFGVGWAMSGLIVGFILLGHVVVSRIVAETGLPFFRFMGAPQQVFTDVSPGHFSGTEVYFAQTTQTLGAFASRESVMTFTLHGLEVGRRSSPAARGRGMMGAIGLALVLSFVFAAGSSLWCYYHYSNPLMAEEPYLNSQGLEIKPRDALVDPLIRHANGAWAPKQHSPGWHILIGAGVTGLLQAAALRWGAWPFLPVGYVASATWYIQMAWFSIFLGWLAKMVILRFGGSRMFQSARGLFIGMIFGEALAAALWLVVNLWLAWNGEVFKPISVLPL